MNEQASLSDVTAEGVKVERTTRTHDTAEDHRPEHDTRLLSESSPRLTPEGHEWLGTRPLWCSDCSDVVDRVPV